MSIIVAGFGNVLRRDDGFGVAVAQRLLAGGVPAGVRVLDAGIGGIHVVQELLSGVDALLILDAVEVDRPAGTLVVIDPPVTDLSALSVMARRDLLADMHYATPERALLLADALAVRPPVVQVLGVSPVDADGWGEELSAPVAAAVEPAVAEVRRMVTALGVPWSDARPAAG